MFKYLLLYFINMKYLFIFCNFLNIIISLIIIKLSLSSNQTSPLIPVKKILITDDVKTLSLSRISRYNLNSIGFGIKFDNTSNVSYVPYIIDQKFVPWRKNIFSP